MLCLSSEMVLFRSYGVRKIFLGELVLSVETFRYLLTHASSNRPVSIRALLVREGSVYGSELIVWCDRLGDSNPDYCW